MVERVIELVGELVVEQGADPVVALVGELVVELGDELVVELLGELVGVPVMGDTGCGGRGSCSAVMCLRLLA